MKTNKRKYWELEKTQYYTPTFVQIDVQKTG